MSQLALAVLPLTVDRWRALVAAVPRAALEEPAGEGEWSALDCLRHLASTEQLWTDRLRDFRAGRDEVTVFRPPDTDLPGSPEGLVEALAERRAEGLALLEALRSHGSRTDWHQVRGAFTLDGVVNSWAAHDLQHTVQAEEALMQPLIRRSGILRDVFADHDVERKAHSG